MVSQRRCDAKAQSVRGNNLVRIKNDRAIALEFKFAGKQGSKRFNQLGLAIKVNCVLRRIGFLPAEPDGAAAFALRCDVSGLAPFERFFQYADTFG